MQLNGNSLQPGDTQHAQSLELKRCDAYLAIRIRGISRPRDLFPGGLAIGAEPMAVATSKLYSPGQS